jgi:hypothetical protein
MRHVFAFMYTKQIKRFTHCSTYCKTHEKIHACKNPVAKQIEKVKKQQEKKNLFTMGPTKLRISSNGKAYFNRY